jgi:hypothetical protein
MKVLLDAILIILVVMLVTIVCSVPIGYEAARKSIRDDCRLERQFRIGDVVYTCSQREKT